MVAVPSLRRFTPLILAVIVALTSLTMAVARGQGRPVGQAVLCLGLGTVSIAVDAQGRPTGPVHLCPDQAPALFVADGIAAPPMVSPLRTGLRLALPPVRAAQDRIAPAPRARGPPSAV